MLFILTRISGYASEGFSQDCLGKPFRFEITPSSSYAAAARSCGDSGGRLMVLSNADLNQCVVNVIRAAGKEGYNFWIGLTRTGPGPTQFIWNDGVSLQTSNFANWGKFPDRWLEYGTLERRSYKNHKNAKTLRPLSIARWIEGIQNQRWKIVRLVQL